MSGSYKVAWLCEALLVSRSGYYDWRERRVKPGPRELVVSVKFSKLIMDSSGIFGCGCGAEA